MKENQCQAVYDGVRCTVMLPLATLCRFHKRQQRLGSTYTQHKIRRPRSQAFVRNKNGQKECGRCLLWLDELSYNLNASSSDGLQNWCASCVIDHKLLIKWNMTKQDILDLVESQGGCGICGANNLDLRNWHVDHDHSCCPPNTSCGTCIRGILCSSCNLMLGYAKDSISTLTKAVIYLENS